MSEPGSKGFIKPMVPVAPLNEARAAEQFEQNGYETFIAPKISW